MRREDKGERHSLMGRMSQLFSEHFKFMHTSEGLGINVLVYES